MSESAKNEQKTTLLKRFTLDARRLCIKLHLFDSVVKNLDPDFIAVDMVSSACKDLNSLAHEVFLQSSGKRFFYSAWWGISSLAIRRNWKLNDLLKRASKVLSIYSFIIGDFNYLENFAGFMKKHLVLTNLCITCETIWILAGSSYLNWKEVTFQMQFRPVSIVLFESSWK